MRFQFVFDALISPPVHTKTVEFGDKNASINENDFKSGSDRVRNAPGSVSVWNSGG